MSRLKRETIRGEPIRVGDHEIVPEARVWSWQTKEAVIRDAQHASGRGALIVRIQPTALIERTANATEQSPAWGGTRRIRVIDANRQLEMILLIAAMLLPIVLNAIVILTRHIKTSEA